MMDEISILSINYRKITEKLYFLFVENFLPPLTHSPLPTFSPVVIVVVVVVIHVVFVVVVPLKRSFSSHFPDFC